MNCSSYVLETALFVVIYFSLSKSLVSIIIKYTATDVGLYCRLACVILTLLSVGEGDVSCVQS